MLMATVKDVLKILDHNAERIFNNTPPDKNEFKIKANMVEIT